MDVWKQIDAMKAKYVEDMKNAKAAAEAYKFVGLGTLPHGEWVCRSSKTAKHATKLRATSADDLVKQMQATFTAAEKKSA